jgi:hypothetical protein
MFKYSLFVLVIIGFIQMSLVKSHNDYDHKHYYDH